MGELGLRAASEFWLSQNRYRHARQSSSKYRNLLAIVFGRREDANPLAVKSNSST